MAKREMKTQNVEETKVEQTIKETVPEKKEEKTVSIERGVVVDCSKLNIRKEPKKDAHIVLIVDAGAELEVIDPGKHKGEWYKVVTANKVHGFCMKKYVKLS